MGRLRYKYNPWLSINTAIAPQKSLPKALTRGHMQLFVCWQICPTGMSMSLCAMPATAVGFLADSRGQVPLAPALMEICCNVRWFQWWSSGHGSRKAVSPRPEATPEDRAGQKLNRCNVVTCAVSFFFSRITLLLYFVFTSLPLHDFLFVSSQPDALLIFRNIASSFKFVPGLLIHFCASVDGDA